MQRIMIRLPDLSSPVVSAAAPSGSDDSRDPFDEAKPSASESAGAGGRSSGTAQLWLTRAYKVVGQPRFWLACMTAIGVQVVLALVCGPATKPAAASRISRRESGALPPAGPERIVVPPAETPARNARGALPAADILAAPQMQPAPPADAGKTWDTLPPTEAESSEGAANADHPPSAPRLAEQTRRADDPKYDGAAALQPRGATLDGVVPIDDAEVDPPNSGNR